MECRTKWCHQENRNRPHSSVGRLSDWRIRILVHRTSKQFCRSCYTSHCRMENTTLDPERTEIPLDRELAFRLLRTKTLLGKPDITPRQCPNRTRNCKPHKSRSPQENMYPRRTPRGRQFCPNKSALSDTRDNCRRPQRADIFRRGTRDKWFRRPENKFLASTVNTIPKTMRPQIKSLPYLGRTPQEGSR